MSKLLSYLALSFLLAGYANAATVTIADPPGLYAEGVITLDAAGTVRWNTQALDTFYPPYVLSGTCAIDTTINSFTNQRTKIGFTCTTPGQVHLTTAGQVGYTCAYDGAILESRHLTLQLDGNIFYDKPLLPSSTVCYVTPATVAAVSWNAPVVTFNNTAQAQPSLTTTLRVQDAAWNYSTHHFSLTSCGPNLVNVGTRFAKKMKEIGFVCEAIVPAHAVLTVRVQ